MRSNFYCARRLAQNPVDHSTGRFFSQSPMAIDDSQFSKFIVLASFSLLADGRSAGARFNLDSNLELRIYFRISSVMWVCIPVGDMHFFRDLI